MKIIIYLGIITLMSIGCMSLNRNADKLEKEIIIQNYISNYFNNYIYIHAEIENLINIRIKNSNKTVTGQFFRQYKVDNLFVFNKDSTKLYTTINTKAGINAIGSSDLIQSLYGVKIDGKWLVFLGANLIAMRGGYKYNKYEPFTWDEISYMAHEQMFGRYVSYSNDGDLSFHPDIVEKYVNPEHIGGSSISQDGTEKERFLRLWEFENSQTFDSTEIAQIKEDLEAGKNKPRDPIKIVTWWDRLWGKEVPIFETDEWNEYVKGKNKEK